MSITEALVSLRPNAEWTLLGEEIIWSDTIQTKPTQSEIDTEIIRLQAEYVSQEYARNRKAAYDALNQLELISDDAINGTTTHKDAIVAIKTKYPKG